MKERTFSLRRVAQLRAVTALLWAVGLITALGTDPDGAAPVPTVVALLLVAYPLIDALSSAVEARRSRDPLPIANGLISLAASVALAVVTATADAGAALAVFGVWAVVSGVVLLGAALRRRRAGSRELPMIVSGGVSALAGLSFVAGSTQAVAHLSMLAGYATAGAVLYLIWSVRAGR